MPQPEKIQKVEEITEALSQAQSIFMTDFTGLSVEEVTELRREFLKNDVSYIVVKNTLAKLSAEKVGYDMMKPHLVGPTALALANSDPVAPARVISEFQKKVDKLGLKGAVLEGQWLDEKAADEIKNIPPREVLLGQVVSGIAAPLSGLVGGLNSLMTKLVVCIDQIKDKKEE